MKALTVRYDVVLEEATSVKQWLDKQNEELKSRVQEEKYGMGTEAAAGAAIVLLLLLLFFCIAAILIKEPMPPSVQALLGFTGFAFVSVSLYTMVGSAIESRRTKELRERKHRELEESQKNDPLFQRALLIQRALLDYGIHCETYRRRFDDVELGLQAGDPKMDAYHEKIARAHDRLRLFVRNFNQAVALTERQLELHKKYPELAQSVPGTALTELLNQLEEPIDLPPHVLQLDPASALEREEDLEQLLAEQNGDDLTRRIEAAATRASLPAKAG